MKFKTIENASLITWINFTVTNKLIDMIIVLSKIQFKNEDLLSMQHTLQLSNLSH